jgi:hypothetical protein
LVFTLTGTKPYTITYNNGTADVVISGINVSPYTLSVSPVATTTYTFKTVQDATCTGIGSGSAAIQVNSAPTASMAGTQTICAGANANVDINFTGASPWSLTYTDGTISTSLTNVTSNPYQFVASPNASVSYTITSISDNNCVGTTSGKSDIVINPTVKATLSGSQTICAGKQSNINVVFTGTSPWDITYTDGTTPVTISGITTNPYSFVVSPTSTSTYKITSVKDNVCTGVGVDSAKVTVKPALDPTCTCSTTVALTGGGNVCAGNGASQLTFNFTGAQPWDLTYLAGVVPQTISGITTSPYLLNVNPSTTTTYSVSTVSNASCTGSATGTAVLLVNNTPTATLSGSANICKSGTGKITVDLTGTQPWKIVYSNGTTNDTISGIAVSPYLIPVSPSNTTTYSLIAVEDATCSGTVSGNASVIVGTQPTVAISGSGSVCAGGTTTLPLALTGTSPWDVTYSNGISSTQIKGIASSPYTLSVTAAATQTLTLTAANDANCDATTSGTATITALAANDPLCTCVSASGTLTGGGSVCAGGIDTLVFNLNGTAPYTVTYNNGASDVSIAGIATSPYKLSVAPMGTTTYSFKTVKDASCTGLGTGSVIIQVNAAPTSTMTGVQTLCTGDTAQLSINLTGASPWSLTYNDGTQSTSISGITANPYLFTGIPISSTTYKVTSITDANCKGTSSGTTDVVINPTVNATVSGSQTICAGKQSNINVVFSGTAPWDFTYTDGTTPVTITGISTNPYSLAVTPTLTTKYKITSVSDKLCTGIGKDSAVVTVKPALDPTCTCSTTVDLTGGGSVCNGTSASQLNLAFTGTAPWDFTYTDGTTPVTITGVAASPYTLNVAPTATSTYSISSVKNTTCTGNATGTAVVLINNVPTAKLNGSSNICSGDVADVKLLLTGTSPWDISYTDGTSSKSITGITTSSYTINVSPTSTKIYSIESVSDKICSGTVSGNDTVIVNLPATATISGTDTICGGTATNFNVVLTGKAPWTITYTDGTTPVTVSGITTSPYQASITPTSTVTYTLVSVSDASCSGSVSGSANYKILDPNSTVCLCTAKATISGGETVCFGTSANLLVDLKGTSPWSLTYSDGTTPIQITNITTSSYQLPVTPLSSKTYRITTVSDNTKCNGIGNGSAIVNVNPSPLAVISGTTSVCEGGKATINVNMIGTAPYSLEYSDGKQVYKIDNIPTNPYVITASPTSTQVFSLTNFKDAQCTGAVMGAAIVTVTPKATGVITGGTDICLGKSTNLNFIFTGNKPWTATYSDGFVNKTIANITTNPYSFTVSPTNTTTYRLISVGDSLCSGTINSSTVVNVLPSTDAKCICATTAKLSGSGAGCAGVGLDLKFEFTGASPWKIIYQSILGKEDSLVGLTTSPYLVNVKPDTTTTYTIKSVSNTTCEGNSTGSAPLIIFDSPTAIIGDTTAVCKTGVPAKLTVDLTGQYPWRIVYSNGTTNTTVSGIITNPYSLPVLPGTETTYTLKSVQDQNCIGTVAGSGLVKIAPIHTVAGIGPSKICLSNLNDNKYIFTGVITGSKVKWYATGGSVIADTIGKVDTVLVNWTENKTPTKNLYAVEKTALGCETDTVKFPITFDDKGYVLNVVTDSLGNETSVNIKWKTNGMLANDQLSIYRRKKGTTAWTLVKSLASNIGQYTDANLETSANSYEYYLKGSVKNTCGDTVQTAIHNTILLSANTVNSANNYGVNLKFTPYKGWSKVASYQVWVKTDADQTYKLDTILTANDSTVNIKVENVNQLLCYKVLAIESLT